MAAEMEQCVRIKLIFDSFDLEQSWFLITLEHYKTIRDIEQTIISKFDLLSENVKLILSECRLPSWESVTILRDNDTVHVVEDNFEADTKKKTRKNKERKFKDNNAPDSDLCVKESSDSEVSLLMKKQEALKKLETACLQMGNGEAVEADQENAQDQHMDHDGKESEAQSFETVEKRKRKRKRKKKRENNNEEENLETKPTNSWPVNKAVSLNLPNVKAPRNKRIKFSDGEDEPAESSINDAASITDNQFVSPPHILGTGNELSRNGTPSNSSVSNLSLTAESVLPNGIAVYTRHKKKPTNIIPLTKKAQLNTVATNVSVVLTNSVDTEGVLSSEKSLKSANDLPTDYSMYPNIEGPPRKGDRIAYKTIELSSSFCPEVSAYKEAVILSYDPISTMVELEITKDDIPTPQFCNSKFAVDDTEDRKIDPYISTEWSSLLEPKILS